MLWFRALPLLIRFAIYAGAVVAVLGTMTAGYFGWRHHQRVIGYQRALEDIAKVNAAAKVEAGKVLDRIDRCEADGGFWNVSTGTCDR